MNTPLLKLKLNCQKCTLCNLHQRRTNVVFGSGNPNSPLVLIGEGPGDLEDQSGEPFIGKAGQLLNRALNEANLDREQIYITNTVKCRAADWSTGKPKNRPPTPQESMTCRTWLIPQLQALNPKVILAIGAPSAKNLIKPKFKITQERGKVFTSDFAPKAIATLHPSYILRCAHGGSDGGFSHLVEDLKLAWSLAQ